MFDGLQERVLMIPWNGTGLNSNSSKTQQIYLTDNLESHSFDCKASCTPMFCPSYSLLQFIAHGLMRPSFAFKLRIIFPEINPCKQICQYEVLKTRTKFNLREKVNV